MDWEIRFLFLKGGVLRVVLGECAGIVGGVVRFGDAPFVEIGFLIYKRLQQGPNEAIFL